MRLLLQHGAKPNAADAGGRSCLSVATSADSLELVRLLRQHGADSHRRDHSGRTAVWESLRVGSVEIPRLLREERVVRQRLEVEPEMASATDCRQRLPVTLSLANGHTNVAACLPAHGYYWPEVGGGVDDPVELLHVLSSVGDPGLPL